jgi:hypothetical protein
VAGHQLIDAHLAGLAARLPADVVEELADGLFEAWQHQLAAGRPPADAARAAIAEFGDPDQITRAFVAQAPGRRRAMVLLAPGPLVGVGWGASLLAAGVWTWPIPAIATGIFVLVLFAVVGALVISATSRRSYRRTQLGTAGGAVLVVLDAVMLGTVLVAAPALVWPMAVAIPASLVRIGVTVWSGFHLAVRT